MVCAANDDWYEDQIIVAPHTGQGASFRPDLPSEAHDRIGVALQAMYADLLLQPLSPKLAQLVQQIRTQHETSNHGG